MLCLYFCLHLLLSPTGILLSPHHLYLIVSPPNPTLMPCDLDSTTRVEKRLTPPLSLKNRLRNQRTRMVIRLQTMVNNLQPPQLPPMPMLTPAVPQSSSSPIPNPTKFTTLKNMKLKHRVFYFILSLI